MSSASPKNLCIARTPSLVRSGQEVVLQVMNVGPTPITIYKGIKLREATPQHNLMLVVNNINDVLAIQTDQSQFPDFNFNCSDLTISENTQLQNLLAQFADLFVAKGRPVGRTLAVKHSILTEGQPVQQPLRSISEVDKSVVDVEVTKMLEQGVVKPSSMTDHS